MFPQNIYVLMLILAACNILCEDNSWIVSIQNGQIKGQKHYTVGDGKPYFAFKGIPYAEPPVGELRFQAPVPKKNWDGVLSTINDVPSCIVDSKRKEGQEDCLYLNVYTPKADSSGTLLPVMFYIYGGAFRTGSASYDQLGPDYFLEEEVLVVTFNYRVGILGFISTEDLVAPGNYGLKDQLLALEWIQSNIEKFGGDAKKVTIFGHSAGGFSVGYLLQSPRSAGLFQRAILQSGTSLELRAFSRHNLEVTRKVAKALGVDSSNSTILIEGLKKLDPYVLQKTAMALADDKYLILSEGLFTPNIEPQDAPDAIVTGKNFDLLSQGQFQKVPMIVGYNTLEGTRMLDYLENSDLEELDLHPEILAPIDLNIKDLHSRIAVGEEIKKHYFKNSAINSNPEARLKYFSDNLSGRPIQKFISLTSKYTPVYFYIFAYQGQLTESSRKTSLGVGHAESVAYFWRSTKNASEEDVKFRKRIIKLWTNFAKSGNPTPGADPLFNNILWPKVSSNLIALSVSQKLEIIDHPDVNDMKFWDKLYGKYGNPPFDTY